jgi:hypothetical protein
MCEITRFRNPLECTPDLRRGSVGGYADAPMAEVQLAFGQRLLPAVSGEQHLATAYAAIGQRQIACLADGTVGTLPLRLAAQLATSTVVARLRVALGGDRDAQVADALIDAHDAVRRGLAGTPQEGAAGAAVLVAVVDCDDDARTVVARVGQGRAWVLGEGGVRPVFRDPSGEVGLGFGRDVPEADWARLTLAPGERLLLVSESAATVLAADVERVAHHHGAQLTVQRLAETAQRRGQHDAVGLAAFERLDAGGRDGPHPAFSRMDRDRPLTYDEDGRLLGAQFRDTARPGHGARAGAGGWLGVGFAGVMLGVLTALMTMPKAPPTPEVAVAIIAPSTTDTPPTTVPAPAAAAPIGAIDAPPAAPEHPDITRAFEATTAARLALSLRGFVTRHYPEMKDACFRELDAAFLNRARDGKLPGFAVEALVSLARDETLKRTARWAAALLPRLVAGDGGAVAAPAEPGPTTPEGGDPPQPPRRPGVAPAPAPTATPEPGASAPAEPAAVAPAENAPVDTPVPVVDTPESDTPEP